MNLMKVRLPFARLEAYIRSEGSARAIGTACGMNHSSVTDYRVRGIPLLQADRVACRLGVHPANIWPEYWTAGIEALDD